MNPLRLLGLGLLGLTLVSLAPELASPAPVPEKDKDGFVPMFNGKDLAGWVNVNCAPGTFFVKENEIITTGKPTGYLRTEKQYENFIADFEWMHVPPKPTEVGNSGFFVWADPIPAVGTGYTRGIEVQVLVNLEYKNKKGEITATSHGDLFSIWGAKCEPDRPHPEGWERCLPSENRAKGAGEWNHYRVEANDGVIKLEVNGKVVSGVSKCSPRKGYLALESEGSECHFRNLKIKELPSTNPKKEEIADEAQGHVNLYTGLDLSGWKADDGAKKHWQAKDTVLHYDGKGEAKNNALATEKDYDNAEFIVDFRFPAEKAASCTFALGDGKKEMTVTVTPEGKFTIAAPGWNSAGKGDKLKPAGDWNRLRVTLKGAVAFNGTSVVDIDSSAAPKKATLALRPEGEMDFANLFVREIKDK
jgi:Domain of Unknown Function (DUF1080)